MNDSSKICLKSFGSAESVKSAILSDKVSASNDALCSEDSISKDSRETWGGKFDFILSCVGYAIGLGNIWRFPYLCFKNGGGAFLIPYFTFLILCGIPMVFMEMSLGQFSSSTPLKLFSKFSPALQGVGVAMLVVSTIVCVYYNIIMTWTLYYLFLSLKGFPNVPWSTCDGSWATEKCVVRQNASANYTNMNTASRDFFEQYVLKQSDGIDEIGEIQYPLAICLFVAWLLVFLCVFHGIKTSGKIVYFTATFPYVVIFILLGFGLSLEGSGDGIAYFLSPSFSKLGEIEVWQQAASQVFYSVAPGWGGFLTFASYNRFRHNVYRDAIVVPCINCFTSLLAGCAVFSIVGFMAKVTGSDIENAVSKGPGLVFIVYPEAVSHFGVPSLWATMFFVMILFVGVDSQFGMFETVIGGVTDMYPWLRQGHRKTIFSGVMCFILAVLGLPSTTQGGIYVLELIDHYSATFSLQIICLLECFMVVGIYGADRFLADIKLMVGVTPSRVWKYLWMLVAPVIIGALLLSQIFSHQSVTYKDKTPYPAWAVTIGWIMTCLSIVPIILIAFVVFWRCNWDWRKALRPRNDFGPSQLEDRLQYAISLNTGVKARLGPEIDEIELSKPFRLEREDSP